MKRTIPSLLLAFAATASVFADTKKTADDIIGRIGGISVNAEDVKGSLAALSANDGAAIKNDPALLNQVVRSLLVQRVLLQEAEAQGHDKNPEVAAQLAKAREVALTESYLLAVSIPPESFPSEAELLAAYEVAKPQIGVPKSFHLAQIFISTEKDTEKAQTKIDHLQKALKSAPADFGKLAAQHSEEIASAGRQGEIGWLAETQIQPEIREKLGALKVDAISDPVRLKDGWHIIKVLDAREPYTPTLEQIRTQLVTQLRAEKTRANSQAYLAKLLQENPLAINELALGQIAESGEKK